MSETKDRTYYTVRLQRARWWVSMIFKGRPEGAWFHADDDDLPHTFEEAVKQEWGVDFKDEETK